MSKITRTDFTRQCDHIAVIAHGAHPQYRLEIAAPVAVESASLAIRQGSVVSLNTSGSYVLGCAAGSGVNYPVPAISLKNVFDPDVTTGVAGSSYKTTTYSAIGGKITAVPCTGSYEIETSEYDTSATYLPGDVVVPAVSGGSITVGSEAVYANSTPIMGFVTHAPVLNNTAGANVVGFLCSFFPAVHGEVSSGAVVSSGGQG